MAIHQTKRFWIIRRGLAQWQSLGNQKLVQASMDFSGRWNQVLRNSLDAAIRELREEVGINVEASSLSIAKQFICHSEFKKDHATAFEIVLQSEPSVRLDGFEVVESEFVDFANLCDRRHEFTEAVNCYIDWKLNKKGPR